MRSKHSSGNGRMKRGVEVEGDDYEEKNIYNNNDDNKNGNGNGNGRVRPLEEGHSRKQQRTLQNYRRDSYSTYQVKATINQ